MAKYTVDNNIIINLYSEGLTNRKIAKNIGVPHWFIGRKIRELDLTPNGRIRGKRITNGELSKCSVCGEWWPTFDFPKGRSSQKDGYYLTYCKRCRKNQIYSVLNNNIASFLNDRWGKTKQRANKENIIFTITKDEFQKQYNLQGGKCFYTGEVMETKVGSGKSRKSLSVDKIIPQLGYTNGNVVFCTNQVNTAKGDFTLEEIEKYMPGWYKKIQSKLTTK